VVQVERRLAGSGQDWSDWSDNYAFLLGDNPTFLEENLNAGHMRSMELDLMAFADSTGMLVHVEGFDIDADRGVEISAADRAHLAGIPGLLRRGTDAGAEIGIVDLPSGPMIVAALPVRTTEGEGPAAGTLVFGVRLGRAMTEQLSSMVQLPVRLLPPSDLGEASVETPRIDADGSDLVIRSPLPTLEGHSLVVEVREPRTVWAQGLAAARTGFLLEAGFIALVAVGAGLLAWLFLRARDGRAAVERMTVALQQCSADAVVLVDAANLHVIHANPATARISGPLRPDATLFDALLVQPARVSRALDAASEDRPARLD
jgi:sensor domain CHASE-containing protein